MRKKMLKAAGILCLSVVLCMGMAGCSGKENGEPTSPDARMTNESDNNEDIETGGESGSSNEAEENQEDTDNADAENSGKITDNSEEGTFYDGANLCGRVVDFTDTGFTITPTTMVINEDGSMEGGTAAPSYESDETNINITYAEDVVFQIINFSMSLQAETSREDTDKSSIKIDTTVNIFGTCQDEKHWIADKVVIERWQ